jgi:hypothetical protein
MEKISSFAQKIDIILRLRKLSIKKVEKALKIDGTFYKAYNENREPREELLMEFLRKFHVKHTWWSNPQGVEESDVFEKIVTPDDIPGDNKEKPEDPIWTQIEKSEKYTVVPTIILDKYEILSNREIESRETTLQEVRATMKIAIAAKDQVIAIREQEIAGLYKNIADLNAKLEALSHPQQTQ